MGCRIDSYFSGVNILFMTLRCPNCSAEMQEVLKYGIHLDYCTTCNGIWLDRGEIDKILEGSSLQTAQPGSISHDRGLSQILAELRKEGRIS